jgi:hypothetical protein
MAGRVCSQCGGPLDPEVSVCPWCTTPVVPQTKVVVQTVYEPDFDLDEAALVEPRSASLASGVVLLALGVILFVVVGLIDDSCASSATCNLGGEVVVGILGLIFVCLGLWALASQRDLHPRNRGF